MGLSGRGMHVQRPCGRKEEVNDRCLESREHGQKGGMSPKRGVGPLRWDLWHVGIGIFILSAMGGAKGLSTRQ